MNTSASAIIKLGGSLFGVPDLASRLANFLRDFSRPRPILVCGGGPSVELIRNWDRIYNLGEEESHWLALRILSINSRVVSRLLPELLTMVDSFEGCFPAWERDLVPVYDSFQYMVEIDETSQDPLPRRWRVTSDTISARMAVTFGAPELILLKSVTLPERVSLSAAAEEGWVDPHFPVAARPIERIVSVNLRAAKLAESIFYDRAT